MYVDSWAFLVSRNKYLDYRSVIAPDFICEAKISNLLARVADGELTESGKAYIRIITDSKVGDFTIVFRVIKATEKDINSNGEEEILKDPFGREIFLIKGFVLNGIQNKRDVYITDQDIEDIHKPVAQGYRQFWEYSEPHPAIPSTKFPLTLERSNASLALEELQPFHVNPRSSQPRNKVKENDLIQPVKPAKSVKPKINLAAAIVGVFLLLMLTERLIGSLLARLGGLKDACTTVQEVEIPIKDNISNYLNELEKWKKEHPNTEIFLSGSLPVPKSLPGNFDSLKETKRPNVKKQPRYPVPSNQNKSEEESVPRYTLVLDINSLKMEDHPLDLAIIQLKNLKVVAPTNIQANKIQVKIISRKECTDS